tara:strand:- start:705 stop:1370 length:666 start_codon:yes stop_codon:yes gene_type:complete
MSKTTPKGRAAATALPSGSNVLAKAIGRRLQLIREERGIDIKEAAKQCGLPHPRWVLFEKERVIPSADEIERICRWAFEGVNFWYYPLSKERKKKRIAKGDGWSSHEYNVPKETNIRIMRAAKRLGISVSALTQLAVEAFLEGENVLSTYEEAAARIRKAEVVDRVNEDPYLAGFLSGDLDIAVNMGAKLTEPKKETRKAPAERMVERFYAQQDDEWETIS